MLRLVRRWMFGVEPLDLFFCELEQLQRLRRHIDDLSKRLA